MQRSKQQALMFLLGAVLVGGALGFSADRVLGRDKTRHWAPRSAMYDDLGLSLEQRVRIDSLLDDRNCQISALMKPAKAQIDSIKRAGRQQMLQMLTPAQREKFEMRVKEKELRDSLSRERRDNARRESGFAKPTTTCKA